jgi:hypothetical protein
LRLALGDLGLQAEDAFTWFKKFNAIETPEDRVAFFRDLAGEIGLTAEQMELVDMRIRGLAPATRFTELAEGVGMTREEFDNATDEVLEFEKAMHGFDDAGLTDTFLKEAAAADDSTAALVRKAEALAADRGQAEDSTAVYQILLGLVADLPAAEQDAALAFLQTGTAAGAAATEVQRKADADREAAETAEMVAKANDMLAESFETVRRNMVTPDDNTGMQWASIDRFGQALADVTGIQSAFVASQDAIWESALSFGEQIDENSRSLGQNSLEGLKNRGVIADWSADILAGVQASLAQGSSVADVTAQFEHNRQAMIDAAVAAGFEESEVLALVDALGLADGDWEAALKVNGHELAMQKIETMLLELDKIDEDFLAEINARIETDGAVATANWLFDYINNQEPVVDVRVRVRNPVIRISNGGATVTAGNVRADAYAMGGYIGGPTLGLMGEAGPEAVLPLGNPGRMAAILGMPQVFGPVAKAMAGMTSSFGGARGGDVYNVNVHNHGRDLTPADVARAIEMSRRAA